MLTINIGSVEHFDEETSKFVELGGFDVDLEHSLLSLSEWESKWEKPFLGDGQFTPEELLDYVRCMIVSPNPPPDVLSRITEDHFAVINQYINRKMTATWFNDPDGKTRLSEIITAELVYYWMTAYKIPFECEKWHLNKLFTLIRICNAKQTPPKKLSAAEAAARNRQINERNRAKFGTKG